MTGVVTATGVVAIDWSGLVDGTLTSPTIVFASDTTAGFYFADSVWNWGRSSVYQFDFNGSGIAFKPTGLLGWRATASGAGTLDTSITRASANSLVFGPSVATSATTRTEINKAVTAFTNAVAKATFTITIPNAAHSASILVRLTGSLGAGGTIGANEATATNSYIISINRTAGVNAAAAISAAFGGAASAVVGAATVTCTAAVSAVSGAVGATNTFTVDVTISRSAGTSDNHTCLCYGQVTNANATGVTIA